MKTEMHHGFRSDSLVSSAVKHIPFYCARARAQQLKTKLDRSNVPSIQSRLTLPEQRLLGEQSTTTTRSQSILSREGREAQEEQAGEGIPCKAFQDAKVWERAHAKAVRFSSLRIWRETLSESPGHQNTAFQLHFIGHTSSCIRLFIFAI